MNKYLEKIASWNRIGKFLGNVSGRRLRDHETYVKNVADFRAHNRTFNDLANKGEALRGEKIRDRVIAGAGATAIAAGGVAGVSHIRKKQREETARQYEEFFKSAAVMEAGKDMAKGILSGLGRAAGSAVKKSVDVINTANGGKLMQYAHKVHGIAPGSKEYDALYNAKSLRSQIRTIYAHSKNPANPTVIGGKAMGSSRIRRDVVNLTNQRTNARLLLGATAATGATGLALHREKKLNQERNYYN